MKKLLFFAMVLFIFSACNSVGSKDTIVARVGSESVYQEDFDLLEKFNVARTSSDKAKVRENVLLLSALVSKAVAEYPEIDSLWKKYYKLQKYQMMQVVYKHFYLNECLGVNDDELFSFFQKNQSRYGDDVSFVDVRKAVAEDLYIAKNSDSLKSYVAKMLPKYDRPMRIEALLYVGDSAAVVDMNKKFNDGVPENMLEGLQELRITHGNERKIFKDSSVIRALFLQDSMRVGEGKSFAVADSSGMVYFTIKLKGRTSAVKAKEEDEIENLKKNFVASRRNFLLDEMNEKMKAHWDFVYEKPSVEELMNYYENHKNLFVTLPGFELYHVAMKDSAKLSAKVKKISNFETFKQLAATQSQKSATTLDSGYIGKVKKNLAIPYGIGMMPALFAELEGKTSGFVSSAIYSPSDSLFHIFYVSSLVPSRQKEFERVKSLVENRFEDDIASMDSTHVLVSKKGNPVVTEGDIRNIFEAETGLIYNKENHDRLLQSLVQSISLIDDYKRASIDRRWEYRGVIRNSRSNLAFYQYEKKLIQKGTLAESSKDIPEKLLKYEYFSKGGAKYGMEGFEQNKAKVAANVGPSYRNDRNQRLLIDAWRDVPSFFYDRSLDYFVPKMTEQSLFATADSLAGEQKFEEAAQKMNEIVRLYSDRDSVFNEALLRMAQYFCDSKQFDRALICYNVVENSSDDSSTVETAVFNRAFTLSENLHRDADALAVLEEFLKKYPNSQFKESAEWLISNIKSNGKVAQDLLKKIESADR